MANAPNRITAQDDEPVTEVAVRSLRSRLEQVQKYLPQAGCEFSTKSKDFSNCEAAQ